MAFAGPRWAPAALVALTTAFAFAPAAQGFQVSPMVVTIEPSGARSSYRMSIKNTTSVPITVELQSFRMAVDADGARTLTPEEKDLLVFPPQSVIPPGREQLVQVRYVGERALSEPRMYLLRAAQLPIALPKAEGEAPSAASANVMIAFNINTHVFVSPPGAKPALAVTSTQRNAAGDVVMEIRNSGDGIAALRDARYVLQPAAGQPQEILAKDVVLGEVSALPPGGRRIARIPAQHLQGLPGEVTASVQIP